MGIIFKTENRRVIPRLRSFKLSATTGELSILSSNDKEPKFNNSRFLYEQNKAWNNNKTLSHAGDLLSSAYVLGLQSEYLDVAKYIIEIDSNKNSPLLGLAKKILHVTENIYVVAPHDIDLNTKYFKEINVIKQILIKEPKNPIAWMEMGRLYSLLGQIDKANRCVESALFLDKDNRFIARSASRFYHHFSDDKEKALYVIKKSKFLNNDPWLISAEIAYSTILGRFSKLAKVGINYLKNKSYNDHSITELASSLGTLEYDNGNIKEARKYFNQSLIKPNDNSLAQSIWISSNLTGLDIENEQYNLPLAFEAKANHFYEVGSFKHSFEEAMKWHSDEPYSTRPIKLASYISSIFLKEHKKSVALIEKALEITPGDIPLTNNLIYFL